MLTFVSSRELDRKTRAAKTAARSGPVFITSQGKPSRVLITIEAYRALSSGDSSLVQDEPNARPDDVSRIV